TMYFSLTFVDHVFQSHFCKTIMYFSLYITFPARAPVFNTTELLEINNVFTIDAGDGRTASVQAGMQAAALAMTLVVAIIGGIITGLCICLLSLPAIITANLNIL
ncbi:unnamed protein product, partial [Owenia fusiformis]